MSVKNELLPKAMNISAVGEETLQAIRRCCEPGRTIAFFCPDEAFRKNFGRIPELLEQRGCSVLYLYGTKTGDDFECHATSFYVGSGLIERVEGVDLFVTATIMDVLPEQSRKALLIHGSFAPFGPEAHESALEYKVDESLPIELQYKQSLAARTHFSAFARLYDYYFVSTPLFLNGVLKKIFENYCLSENGKSKIDGNIPQHYKIFNKVLYVKKKKLPARIYLVPGGYPQIDANIRFNEDFSGPKDTITFAPTPLNGKPAWNQYSALANAGVDIIQALLDNYLEYRIVFKPHISDIDNFYTEKVISVFANHPRFILDRSGSAYHSLYARTAVLVSDFSSTAYTFALGTLSPVLFYSAIEASMPEALKRESYCSLRQEVGLVASDITEMVKNIKMLLGQYDIYKEKIRKFREINLYNPGNSEMYIVKAIDDILSGQPDPAWMWFGNSSYG